MFLSNSKNRFK